MVEALAQHLATKIKRASPHQTASVPVMKFALIIVINFMVPTVASLLFGAMTGKLLETLTAMGYFIALRILSGGYHFETPVLCMVATCITFALPPHLELNGQWTLMLTTLSLLMVLILAPSNMRGYNTIPEKYYPLLKLFSVLIVCSNFIILSGTAAIVLAVQGITLLFRNKEVKPT